MPVLLIAMHLGALHPVEKVLTLVLAFGPFLLLGAVIMRRRRQDAAAEAAAEAAPEAAPEASEASGATKAQRER